MKNIKGKWLLAVVTLGLAPAAFACPKPVPDGGSTSIYLLVAALSCVGAMFLRSRLVKPPQS